MAKMTGQRLASLRKKLGLTQAEAAKAAGVTQALFSMMEADLRSIPENIAERLGGASKSPSPAHRGPYRD